MLQDDDTISQKSYGSHKIRSFKDESHKGSADTIDGEEKKDASKEELGLEEGTDLYAIEIIRSKIVLKESLTFMLIYRNFRRRGRKNRWWFG